MRPKVAPNAYRRAHVNGLHARVRTASSEGDVSQLKMMGLGGWGSGGLARPVTSGPSVGFNVSAGTT
jgi:hypothetical protein